MSACSEWLKMLGEHLSWSASVRSPRGGGHAKEGTDMGELQHKADHGLGASIPEK